MKKLQTGKLYSLLYAISSALVGTLISD